jgi:hypothetical protein
MEPEKTSIARQQFGKHVPAETRQGDNAVAGPQILGKQPVAGQPKHDLMETVSTKMNGVFYGTASNLYNEDYGPSRIRTRVEAGSNTSTAALRVVGDDVKRTQYLGI